MKVLSLALRLSALTSAFAYSLREKLEEALPEFRVPRNWNETELQLALDLATKSFLKEQCFVPEIEHGSALDYFIRLDPSELGQQLKMTDALVQMLVERNIVERFYAVKGHGTSEAILEALSVDEDDVFVDAKESLEDEETEESEEDDVFYEASEMDDGTGESANGEPKDGSVMAGKLVTALLVAASFFIGIAAALLCSSLYCMNEKDKE